MKRYGSILCVLTLTAGIAAAQPSPTAIIVQQYTFAPVGVASGQTMRLNLSNTGDTLASFLLGAPPTVCMGNLSFVASDGTSIRNQDVTVMAGQTMSFSLLASDIPAAGGVIRGLVKVNRQFGPPIATPGTPPTPVPTCAALMSMEVVDSNGQTHLVLTIPGTSPGIIPILASVPPAGTQ